MKLKTCIKLAVLAACCAPAFALATNGYFSHGYGIKTKGMAGASTATASDTMGGAVNPAKMVFVGNRIDFGADLFSPRRSVSRQGETAFGGIYNGTADSDSHYFIIPEFGYNKMFNPNLSLGVTVYGNGGMNTDFNTPLAGPPFAACGTAQANMLLGCGRLGVDMMQLIIAPTVAYKVNDRHAIGLSPLLGYQRFKVDGLQAFQGISSAPASVTNKGYDESTGVGVRVGWMGKLTNTVSVGAAYSPKMDMSKFDAYRGLFANAGEFDIPENYNVGIAFQATPKTLIAFDVQQINYSEIPSIANGVLNSLVAPPANPLGSPGGSGFRWQDMTVFKLGIEHQYDQNWTLRAGVNHGKGPIGTTANDISFNIIAPGVVETHLTLGLTYKTKSGGELSVSYMHALSKTVTGPSAITTLLGGANFGTESLKMYQNSIGIAYGWKM
ncbi:MAG: outer membrane protein transport protein [Betaproteobacteria bacterium]|nr:outer membrane protein transport protein [Betaproteobacteria bacterium]